MAKFVSNGIEYEYSTGRNNRIENADLSGHDFSGLDLRHMTFYECKMNDCRFLDADCRETVFEKNNLRKTRFARADLTSATFTECDLTKVDFTEAVLQETVLNCVELHWAAGIFDCGKPHGRHKIYVVDQKDHIRIKAGCRWMTWQGAKRYWDMEGSDKPFSGPLLAYIQEIVRINGWTLEAETLPAAKQTDVDSGA